MKSINNGNRRNERKAIVRMNDNDWNLFKKVCKYEGSNASVEIRRFIKDYLSNNTNVINEIMKEEALKND